MYLSRLKLDPRSRVTRTLAFDPYLLHQAVFRAFPDAGEGGPGRVLYRTDVSRDGQTSLLVQSEKAPDWQRADLLTQCLEEPMEKPKDYSALLTKGLKPGQSLCFRLRANPTVKKKAEGKKNGRRMGLLREEDQIGWLSRKAKEGGFALLSCWATAEGVVAGGEGAKNEKLRHYAVRYEGALKVLDAQKFMETVARGVGSAKGFGFGLVSIAPLKDT